MAGKMLGRCIAAVALALVGYGMIACGDDGGADEVRDCSTSTLTYESFAKTLFEQHCTSCHGSEPTGGTDLRLDTVNAIKAQSHEIIERAVDLSEEPTMPFQKDPLPKAEREDLRLWLDCGAPP